MADPNAWINKMITRPDPNNEGRYQVTFWYSSYTTPDVILAFSDDNLEIPTDVFTSFYESPEAGTIEFGDLSR